MRKVAALIALVTLAGLGALVALGTASAGGSDTTPGTTVSNNVVVHSSASCSVSVKSVNGVTTTTKSAGCTTTGSCSISISSVNGATTTTKSGDCSATTVTTSSKALKHRLHLRKLIAAIVAQFRAAVR
jgi:hypothetical protein